MTFKTKLKDYIGILFYRHGLFCAEKSIHLLSFVFIALFLCCFPLKNLPPFGDSIEQFSQNENTFNGLEAESLLDLEKTQFTKLSDIPAWYNRVPVAYIQQIVVKSNINLLENSSFFLSDSFRAPLVTLFELNEFIRNVRVSKDGTSLSDVCLHVGDLKRNHDDDYLPVYNCLVISPANYWQNNENHFKEDENLIEKIANTKLRELLFGVKWSDITKKVSHNRVLQTYAVTLVLKKYDKSYLTRLKHELNKRFQLIHDDASPQFTHLQYSTRSIVYYIPYISLYIILFLYIYISVSKIEFVKSKWGLALAAVSQVIASLFMSLGICSYFGLTPTINSGEVFPYLVIFIGFENIVVLTKSVVSTPFDLDVKYRIALGLQKEAWKITKNLTFELIIIFVGICTMVPAIQEFCAFAYIGLLIDFFMQMTFFVTVLSIDIRRMRLSDLNKKQIVQEQESSTRRSFKSVATNSLIVNKSIKFFYFWARTRLIQRAFMCLSIFWIVLIFYKSLLVVELLRHDVSLSKETVEALLPKSGANRFQNFFSIDNTSSNESKQLDQAQVFIDRTQNWRNLHYFHWFSLFECYNISLHNRFITILPQINVYQEISSQQVLEQRNVRESERLRKGLNFDFFGEANKIKHNSSNLVTNAILELILILIFGFPAMIFLVYFIILVYKCLCSRKYEQWRKKWSTQSIKKQYLNIHGMGSSNSDDSDRLSSGDEEDYKEIMSVNELELRPIRLKANDYQIDLISYLDRWCIGVDFNNEVFIWDLDNVGDRIESFKLNNDASIWSVCLIRHNLAIFGLSNGQLVAYNLDLKTFNELDSDTKSGITQIKTLDKSDNFILCRLSGHLELISSNLICFKSIRAHQNPILNIIYQNDYVYTTSRDRTVQIFHINDDLSRVGSILAEESSDIFCLAVESLVRIIAIGLENGLICVFGAKNGNCVQKLSTEHKNQCTKLEFTTSILISLHLNQRIYMWNYQKGFLSKEISLSHDSLMHDMCLFNNNLLITTSNHGSLLAWDLNTCQVVRKFSFHNEILAVKGIEKLNKQKSILLKHDTNTLSLLQIPFIFV